MCLKRSPNARTAPTAPQRLSAPVWLAGGSRATMQRSSKRRRRARAAPEDDFDVPTGPAAAAAAGAAGAAADSGPASGVEADDFAVFGAPGALTSAGVLL